MQNPSLLHVIPKPQPGELFPQVKTGVRTEPAAQAERVVVRVLKRSRKKQGKEKKRGEVFLGAQRRKGEGEAKGDLGLPTVNTAALDQSSSNSADSTVLFSKE